MPTKKSNIESEIRFSRNERKVCAADVMTPKGWHVSPITNQQLQPSHLFVLQSFYSMIVNNPRRTFGGRGKFMFYAFEGR